MNDKQSSR